MNVEKGKLLVSTKSNAIGRKAGVLIASAILLLPAIYILANPDFAYQMAYDLLGKISLGRIVQIGFPTIMLVFVTISVINIFMISKSYLDVYERGLAGVTSYNTSKPSEGVKKIELSFSDIVNVSESKRCIQIVTKYGSYEFLAVKNREQALSEIRSRIGD